ncbi:beta-galactosidase trimerization domain-containing protein [Cohnella sp. GCM10027633]|uniref:beta-galactosidase trimerization domain-containing protein n=1 Tax=unclassified Cohnella TaxID=2636738 RepID=UPI003634B22E
MRFRQVHLDFHTSEAIAGIGSRFSKEQFQSMLLEGGVDSITVFSKCHHGWAYHPSEANERHPGLDFDLLGAMIEAAHEIGVKTPVYLSAGLDEKLARRHPEWLVRDKDDRTTWVQGFMQPGYHLFCMNTPYLDILLAQVEEVVRHYDADGIFLDIVGVQRCYCQYCVRDIRAAGLDPRDPAVILAQGERTYATYAEKISQVIHGIKPGLGIFHNGGHIRRGRRDLARMNTHLELESLPTGGWGYDHFPLSARYAQTLGMEFLGMTGKFHTSWGEFGGYKHPNALRYEAALNLANGARISVGDQLHPDGLMDEATYKLIGAAYREVAEKEAWVVGASNVADVALLSLEAIGAHATNDQSDFTGRSDAGAVRMLLEGKVLFDVVDAEADFRPYKVVILPDEATLTPALAAKVNDFLAGGGKVLATGRSGLDASGEAFAIDLGAKWLGENGYRPDYFRPAFELTSLAGAAFVFYGKGQRVELDGGVALGVRENPYFNRDVFAFSSHQHTPNAKQPVGPGMIESGNGIYIAWNVFEDYATKGSLVLKETVLYAIDRLLGESRTLRTSLPAQGIATVQRQAADDRYVVHLLYASPVRRGEGVEVIEDLLPVYDTEVTLRLTGNVESVVLAPQGEKLAYDARDGFVQFSVPDLTCHQMIVVQTKEQ